MIRKKRRCTLYIHTGKSNGSWEAHYHFPVFSSLSQPCFNVTYFRSKVHLNYNYTKEKVTKTRRLLDYNQERNTGAPYIYKQG